jgi:hypothetical protein
VHAVWRARHNAVLDLRRDAVRDVWWGREAVSRTSTKLLMWNELISKGTDTPSNWVFQSKVLVHALSHPIPTSGMCVTANFPPTKALSRIEPASAHGSAPLGEEGTKYYWVEL